MHAVVEDLQASRRLDVTLGIDIQTDHSLLTNLLPSVVRHECEFALDDLSCDLSVLAIAQIDAHFAEVLSETDFNLIKRGHTNVVREDGLSLAVLDQFVEAGKSARQVISL